MKLETLKIPSPADGLELSVLLATPDDGEVKGVLQIAHGMCEYVARYLPTMEYFTSKGYAVIGNDHRGHGNSVRQKEDLGWFYDTNGKALVQDLTAITKYAKELYPDAPITLLGHSMGSMASMVYLQENDGLIDKLVLSGSPTKNPAAGIAVFLADVIAAFKGKRHRSKTLYSLSIGAYEKKFATEGKSSWLSVNRENVEKYVQDPFCSYTFTCNGYRNLFSLLKGAYTRSRYKVQNPNLPIFFIAGGDDPVIGGEKQWQAAQAFLQKCGYGSVKGSLHAGYRHELLNEENPVPFWEEILAFIEN